MEAGNWTEIQTKIKEKIKQIFFCYDMDKLSLYEKRKIVFEYLCNNLSYDFKLLEKIKYNVSNFPKIPRNPYTELKSVFDNNIGVCNAISQYYKLLLEEIDIISYCVVCDDGTNVNHQLVVVENIDDSSFSFDDITSVIVGRGTKDEFFDYDLEFANSHNQGNKCISDEEKWVILPEEYIDFLVGREKSKAISLDYLPTNIKSQKNKFAL